MSNTFSIVCEETKKKLWIGEGFEKMTCFYSGEPGVMEKLGSFLREHYGKKLQLMRDETIYAIGMELTEWGDKDAD